MKTKLNRAVSFLLSLTMIFSMLTIIASNTTVFAADYTGKAYITDFPRAADPNKSGWGHGELHLMNGWSESPSKKMALRSLNDYNGPTAYCIEPGIGQHTGDVLHQKGEDYWDKYPSGLNNTIRVEDIKKLIGRILQYGWTGNTSTNWLSTDPKSVDEMGNAKATQILIHEVIVGERRADFSKIDAWDYGCNNVAEQITPASPIYAKTMEHYRRIEAAVKQHTVIPNFGGTQFELDYDGSKYSVTLTDRNNVLSKYNFNSDSNVSISKNGNQLTISTDNPPSGDIKITGNSTGVKCRGFVVWSDNVVSSSRTGNIQDQISYAQEVEDPLPRLNLTLKVSTGNIKIVKEAEDGYKEGFKFHAEGAGVNTDVITGANGEILLNGLRAGEQITFTEKDVDDRYVQPASQTVTVLAGQTTSVCFTNKLKRGAAIFQKTDFETDKEIETKDGIFKIQQWNKDAQAYIEHSTMVYDDAKDGYVTASDLIVTEANEGKFRWVEEKAPTGYLKPAENSIDFTITEDGQIFHINNGKVTNTPQKGRIGVIKTGEILTDFDFVQTEFGLKYSPIYEEKTLDNAAYEITAMNDIYFNGDLKYKKGELVDTLTTKANQYVYSKDLYIGDNGSKFLVREVQAPNHFFLGSNEYEVTLTYQGQEVQLVTKNIESHNDRQKVKVRLQKAIEENTYYPNPNAWQDVIWGIFAAEDITDSNGNVILEKNSLVDCFGIDEAGQGFSQTDFPPETDWYVKELKTANGWLLDENIYPFSFTADDPSVPLSWIDLNDQYGVLENKTVKGFVEFKKISAHDGRPLKATYGLYRASDDMLIEEKESSLTEWTRFSELPKGEYYLLERQEPYRYHKDENKYPFFIGENDITGVTIQITVENEPIIGSLFPEYEEKGGGEEEHQTPQIPKTGDYIPFVATTALAISSVALIGFSAVKKKRKNKGW